MSVKTDRQTKDRQTDGGSTDKRRFRGNEEREKEMKIDAQCYVDRIRKELLQSTTRQKINLRPLSDER